MQFQFAFKHMESSDFVSDYAQRKILEKVNKFVTKPIEAHVTFSVDKHHHTAHCNLVGGDGFNIQVEHTSEDMYGSIDRVIDKLEGQMKRQKEKLKEHRSNVKEINADTANKERYLDAVDADDVIKFERARTRMKA